MPGYIHIAAAGDHGMHPPFLLDIDNVSATAYDAVLYPRRIDTVEAYAPRHNITRARNKNGSFGTLRVLPASIPYMFRKGIDAVDPSNFDTFGLNRTTFSGYFKYNQITLTLSPQVNLEPFRGSVESPYKLDKPVSITVLKYSDERGAFQQFDLETKHPRLHLVPSLSSGSEELDFEQWWANFDFNHQDFVFSERTCPIDPALVVDRCFGHIEPDHLEDEIKAVFAPPPLVSIDPKKAYLHEEESDLDQ